MREAIWLIMLDLAPWLLLGVVVAGILHVLLPPDWLARQLRGGLGVAKAVLLGVPLPLCSCGVIPVALSLRKSKASRGSVVGFLVSTPQTGVDSVLVSAGMLGLPFAIFKVISATITGLVAGWIVDATLSADDKKIDAQVEGELLVAETRRGVISEFLLHADMLLRSIWRWLVFGVLVSAALTTFVPPGNIQHLSTFGPVVAMLLMLVISLPLYVCATASVPIAAALVVAGMPVGAALVFLMAGPATNIATIGAIHRALGLRALVIYLVTIIVGSIAGGLLFEWLLATTIVAPVGAEHTHHVHWIAAGSAYVLMALFAYYLATDVLSLWSRWTIGRNPNDLIEVPVEGMTCEGCVNRLTKTLQGDHRVEMAAVDLKPGRARVKGKIAEAELRRLIGQAGFESPRQSPEPTQHGS